ncbi:fused MFS/spermidine synthase [Deltaproteobacteria bacterium IMCC39524]|nr:fused MFS/spermidine synthase [Deltaproteobacteria bacterium IMCC39524]
MNEQQSNTPHSKMFVCFLILTSLTGGSLIMVVEVLGSKVIGPFFGASLFVWTSLISVAMIALAAGYAFGGFMSDRRGHADYLYGIIALSGIAVLLIPSLTPPVLKLCMPLGLRTGAFLSSCMLFGPSLFLMGCISPYVIKIAAKELHSIGRTVGSFYAISTIGSVLGTISTGFVLIAFLGVKQIFFLVGCLLLLLSVLYFTLFRKKAAAVLVLLPLFFFWPADRVIDKVMENGTRVQVVASEKSYYGDVKVVDYSYREKHTRELVIDGLVHSGVDMKSGRSIYPYTYILPHYVMEMNPQGKDCLMLGLGAGTIPGIFQAHGVMTDVLDIDPVVFDVAETYFNFRNNGKSIVEDARYYLINTPRKYDFVVLDVFSGDTMPAHLLSLEAYELINQVLSPGGIMAFNLFGSLDKDSYMTASIIKTLQQVFENVDIFPNFNPVGPTGSGNISVFAYNGASRTIQKNLFSDVASHPFVANTLNFQHLWKWRFSADDKAIILTDNYIPLEFYNAWISEQVRKNIVETTDWDVLSS